MGCLVTPSFGLRAHRRVVTASGRLLCTAGTSARHGQTVSNGLDSCLRLRIIAAGNCRSVEVRVSGSPSRLDSRPSNSVKRYFSALQKNLVNPDKSCKSCEHTFAPKAGNIIFTGFTRCFL